LDGVESCSRGGNQGGGGGETFIATNLAVLRGASGREVLLVAGDDQESTTLWRATRSEILGDSNRIAAIQPTGRGFRRHTPFLRPSRPEFRNATTTLVAGVLHPLAPVPRMVSLTLQ